MSESSGGSASEVSSSTRGSEKVDGATVTIETRGSGAEYKESEYSKIAETQSREASCENLGEVKQENADLASGSPDATDSADGFFDAPNEWGGNDLNGATESRQRGEGLDDETEKISYEIHTRNEGLEGDRHPITGVPFERKTVEDADGNEVTGVFPEFDSKFDAQLPEEKLQASDSEQFAECNEQLKAAVENDPELAKQFTSEQLEQIKNGDTPDGYTWHHNEEKGKMQLVDSQTHAQTGHTGGKSIWGGGTENR